MRILMYYYLLKLSCPETSVRNYEFRLRNVPVEYSSSYHIIIYCITVDNHKIG